MSSENTKNTGEESNLGLAGLTPAEDQTAGPNLGLAGNEPEKTVQEPSGLPAALLRSTEEYQASDVKNGHLEIPYGTTAIVGFKPDVRDCMTSVTIPSSVTAIGDHAFSDCGHLGSVTIPSSVTAIGDDAFSRCGHLGSVTIPSSVTAIGNRAFFDCGHLESITIPSSVTAIGDAVFLGCSRLIAITVEPGSRSFSSSDGVLFSLDGKTLIAYPGGKEGSYLIPSSVTAIEIFAFAGCDRLKSVTIPTSVTAIGAGAFFNCKCLESATVPTSVTAINNSTFSFCRNLENVTIPSSVTLLEKDAFEYCPALNLTILNPECQIYDDRRAINTAAICGYAGSTAEAYAKKYGRKFVRL